MAIQRLDNVLLVVDDLDAVKAFFLALGMELEGEADVGGPDVGRLIGLADVRATVAMLRPPGGGAGVELDKFHTPQAVRFGPVEPPVNAYGYRRVMLAVDDLDATLERVRGQATVVGEMRYGDAYRLAYVRGPEGIVVGLAQEL